MAVFTNVVILNEVKDPLSTMVVFTNVVILNEVKDPLFNDLRLRGNGNFNHEGATQDAGSTQNLPHEIICLLSAVILFWPYS